MNRSDNRAAPLIAILRGVRPDEVLAHGEALVAAGLRMIEVPTNSPDWQTSIRLLREHLPEQVLVGVGTLTCERQLEQFVATGARLMVTPNADPALIRQAKAEGLTLAVGCFSPSEMFAALNAGADMLKLFPVSSMDASFIKAVQAVLPVDIPVLAVGGVTPSTLLDYLALGLTGAGLGSDLYRAGQSPQDTARKAREFVAALSGASFDSPRSRALQALIGAAGPVN